MEILQTFENLTIIANAPWYVTNDTLHHDLNVPYVKDEIQRLGQRYAGWRNILTNSRLIS